MQRSKEKGKFRQIQSVKTLMSNFMASERERWILVLHIQLRKEFLTAVKFDQRVSGSLVGNPPGEGDEDNASFSLNELARLFFILRDDEMAKSAFKSAVGDEMNRSHLYTRVTRESY